MESLFQLNATTTKNHRCALAVVKLNFATKMKLAIATDKLGAALLFPETFETVKFFAVILITQVLRASSVATAMDYQYTQHQKRQYLTVFLMERGVNPNSAVPVSRFQPNSLHKLLPRVQIFL